MYTFNEVSSHGHEQVMFCNDSVSGLRVIIALHNTKHGRAMGATRLFPYVSEAEALKDALRLSRGMTYKAACAKIPVGGGKAVIIGDPGIKNRDLLHAYGRVIEKLGGQFVTGQDINLSIDDVRTIAEKTQYVVGVSGQGGGPVTSTAKGVLLGILAAVKFKLKRSSLDGVRVAVQGVGGVGKELCMLLHTHGALLTLSDIDPERAKSVAAITGAQVVQPEEIFSCTADVFAPCSLGFILNDSTIPQLKASIIAGCANNQLADEHHHSRLLMERDILYCPDYVINAGGLINVYNEMIGYDEQKENFALLGIPQTLQEIFEIAESDGITTNEIANRIAEEQIHRYSCLSPN